MGASPGSVAKDDRRQHSPGAPSPAGSRGEEAAAASSGCLTSARRHGEPGEVRENQTHLGDLAVMCIGAGGGKWDQWRRFRLDQLEKAG